MLLPLKVSNPDITLSQSKLFFRKNINTFMQVPLLILFVIAFIFPADLPDIKKTPGDVRWIMLTDICNPYFFTSPEPIPAKNKIAVYVIYKIDRADVGKYRIDRLVPYCLGGSNSIDNLWPQPGKTKWDVTRKKELEKRLLYLVCNGRISLADAQAEIVSDWISAYKIFVLDTTYPPVRPIPDYPRKLNK